MERMIGQLTYRLMHFAKRTCRKIDESIKLRSISSYFATRKDLTFELILVSSLCTSYKIISR